ncbi:MAG: hypothetical protein GXY58_08185 [Planctomycetaceae bacterium]|nr:hypothetical protein [Planctomycetaceae bacterium]
MGANWNEVVGDWGVIGWRCVEDYSAGGSTANALIITTQQQPLASAGEQYLSLDIYDPQTGDIYYLYPACTGTSRKGALEAKFECLDASTSPQTWDVTIGTETETMEIVPNEFGWVRAICCVDHTAGQAKAWMNYGVIAACWDDSADPGAGRYSGFGHDNSGRDPYGIICDNYFVGELWTGDQICYDCFCRCRKFAPSRELKLTIFGATGRYACAGGASTPMLWDNAPEKQYWSGQVQVTGPNGRTITILCVMHCAAQDPAEHEGQNFTLSLDFVDNDCCHMNPDRCDGAEATVLSTCVPFNLVFGPYEATGPYGDLNCRLCYDPLTELEITTGEFWISVTE